MVHYIKVNHVKDFGSNGKIYSGKQNQIEIKVWVDNAEGELHLKIKPKKDGERYIYRKNGIEAVIQNFPGKSSVEIFENKEHLISYRKDRLSCRCGGDYTDKLGRMPWYRDILKDGLNDPAQENAHERWSLSDRKRLINRFQEIGESDVDTWKVIAEREFGRSLYAVEREIRVAYWAEYFAEEHLIQDYLEICRREELN